MKYTDRWQPPCPLTFSFVDDVSKNNHKTSKRAEEGREEAFSFFGLVSSLFRRVAFCLYHLHLRLSSHISLIVAFHMHVSTAHFKTLPSLMAHESTEGADTKNDIDASTASKVLHFIPCRFSPSSAS